MPILLLAIILGIVEGVTEFLPVSSTGHLILATKLLGFDAGKWEAFNVIIQLGAILAIVVLYWRTFWAVLEGLLQRNPVSWRFVRNILIGFLPSAILGFLLLKHIEALLENATVVAIALIIGGIAILVIEKLAKRQDVSGVAEISTKTSFAIGLAQCLAMIPGISRSGATIMGALSGRRAPDRGRVQLLPRHPDHGRSDDARVRQAPSRHHGWSPRRRLRNGGRRPCRQLPCRARRGPSLRPLHFPPRLRAVCLVSDRRRSGRPRLALCPLTSEISHDDLFPGGVPLD